MTAPRETPIVYPVLTRPINSPRRRLLVISITRMTLRGMIPAAPTPAIARPAKKRGRSRARKVTNDPIEKIMVEIKTQFRGEKVWERRPARGDKLAIGIWTRVSQAYHVCSEKRGLYHLQDKPT